MTVPNEPRQAAVYRLYAANDTLLYIGSAYDPDHRCKAHRSKQWWPQVARREDEWHYGRRAAYLAEMRALGSEGPQHNDFGTPGYATPQTDAVARRAESMRVRGAVQSAAWKAWRETRGGALADGLSVHAASEVADAARLAVIEASGLFPEWVARWKAEKKPEATDE